MTGLVIFLRSALFNIGFYLGTAIIAIVTLPVFYLTPPRTALRVVDFWSRFMLVLLRITAGTRLEVRGREHLTDTGVIVAAKHQSAFETVALFSIIPYPAMIMKESLKKIPLFGAYTVRTGMIHVDREGKTRALRKLAADSQTALEENRQLVIFPEGHRQPPGAAADYQPGLAFLYRNAGVPVVPVAHNAGFYWPRRSFLHYPGTIVIEFLPPIAGGMKPKAFMQALEESLETASDRLLAEADKARPRPPFPPEAEARLADLG